MKSKSRKENVIVTGGAGFIGSHLANKLQKNFHVSVLDNFSTGKIKNLDPKIQIKKCNLQNELKSSYFKNCSCVFHMAAQSDVRESMKNPKKYFDNNLSATLELLEQMRKNDVNKIVFASSSVVYGENKSTNTENSPTKPISVYGVSKLLCENLIESYSRLYGMKSVVLRLANIVGPNATKGIIFDMKKKFKKDPKHITVLGNGKQIKSYLHIEDCVNAMVFCFNNLDKQLQSSEIFNVGNSDQITVNQIVQTIGNLLHNQSFKIKYEISDKQGSGWLGDIPIAKLSITKLSSLGWKPSKTSIESIRVII